MKQWECLWHGPMTCHSFMNWPSWLLCGPWHALDGDNTSPFRKFLESGHCVWNLRLASYELVSPQIPRGVIFLSTLVQLRESVSRWTLCGVQLRSSTSARRVIDICQYIYIYIYVYGVSSSSVHGSSGILKIWKSTFPKSVECGVCQSTARET